jgi:RsiW-degrading membrane proteinase PrsW (M82 family)
MAWLLLVNALLGVLPVLTFLATLAHFDSFKLVPGRTIVQVIAAGAGAAVAAYYINTFLLARLHIDFLYFTHFVSPLVEEGLKALLIIALIRTNRVGFMFDAVILGFAIGAGFALVENLFYLKILGLDHPAVWVIRGFGTAIMHGGVAALFAVAGHLLTLRGKRSNLLFFAPGFIVAITLHAGFNFFLDYPVSSTISMMAMLSSILATSMARDSKSIHDWIEVDFNRHRKLLDALNAKRYEDFKLGRLLSALHVRADGEVARDIVDYITTHTELVLKAEDVLLAHERGEKPEIDDGTRRKLDLLGQLEKKIGKTARMVLSAHLGFGRHEFWELYMLEKEAGSKHAHVHGV